MTVELPHSPYFNLDYVPAVIGEGYVRKDPRQNRKGLKMIHYRGEDIHVPGQWPRPDRSITNREHKEKNIENWHGFYETPRASTI